MRFGLSPDQELFCDTTRKFLDKTCDLTEVRALIDRGGGFRREWWREAAELGWTSLVVPEAHGGAAATSEGLVDLALVAELMGARVSPGPLVPVNVVAAAVAASGSEAQRASLLPGLASGETVATWCLADAGQGWQPEDIATVAEPHGDGVRVTGVKSFVEAATDADVFLVAARTGDGLTQLLVPASTPGVEVIALDGLDLVRRFGEVRLDGVDVPADSVLGTVGGARADVERQLQIALVLQCADSAGAAARVLDFTVEYAFDRYSFGRPLASYQALKHRFADMRLWSESCQATTDAAAIAVAEGAASAARLSRVAKAYVGDRAPEIIQDCIQMHGSIGVTWEHDLHLYLRRVTVNRSMYGAPLHHRQAIASMLESGDRG